MARSVSSLPKIVTLIKTKQSMQIHVCRPLPTSNIPLVCRLLFCQRDFYRNQYSLWIGNRSGCGEVCVIAMNCTKGRSSCTCGHTYVWVYIYLDVTARDEILMHWCLCTDLEWWYWTERKPHPYCRFQQISYSGFSQAIRDSVNDAHGTCSLPKTISVDSSAVVPYKHSSLTTVHHLLNLNVKWSKNCM